MLTLIITVLLVSVVDNNGSGYSQAHKKAKTAT